MKQNRLKAGILVIALGAASLFAQDRKEITPPFPPKPLDAQTLAARRAILLNRAANFRQAAHAAAVTNGLAQGAPGQNTGVDSGGQTNGATAGMAAGKVPTVSSPAVIGAASTVGTSPSVGAAPGKTPKQRSEVRDQLKK